jgi:hypothetical protein
MLNIHKNLLIIVLLSVISVMTPTKNVSAQVVPAPPDQIVPTEYKDNLTDDSVKRLMDSWVSLSSQLNDRLIATVYWSLATVTGLALALFAYNWFFNFRLSEREKQALSNELRSEVDSHISRMNAETLSIKEQLNSLLVEEIKASVQKNIDPLKYEVSSLRSTIKDLEYELKIAKAEAEIRYWEGLDVLTNALTYYLELIQLAKSGNEHWRIAHCLRQLEDHIKKKPALAMQCGAILEASKGLSDEIQVIVDRIRRKATEG